MTTHTAATCTIETHDHYGQKENFDNGGGYPPDETDEFICNDCGRRGYYDRGDENYHHLVEPEQGCFLIPPEIDGVFQRVARRLDLSTPQPRVEPRR